MSQRYGGRGDIRFGEQAELEYTFKTLHDAFHFSRTSERLRIARGMVELLRALPDIAGEIEEELKRELELAMREFEDSLSEEEKLYLVDEEYREIVLSPAQRARMAARLGEKQEEVLAWAYYRAAIRVAYNHGLLIRTYTPLKVEVPEIYKKILTKIRKNEG